MDYPGEKFIIKLWDTVAEKGIGSLFRPWQSRRDGFAAIEVKRAERLALAQAEVEAQRILRGDATYSLEQRRLISHAVSNAFSAPTEDPAIDDASAQILEGVGAAIVADTIRKEVNVTKALLFAEEALADANGTPSDESPSNEWFTRWRESAGQVSTEEVQELWGRVLAGELKKPGAFSLRTLDFVRNLDKNDAELLARIAQYRIDDCVFIPEDKDFFSTRQLNFDRMLDLQELGVIAGVEAIGMERMMTGTPGAPFRQDLVLNNHVIKVTSPTHGHIVKFGIYAFTRVGNQAASLAKVADDVDYMRALREKLKSQGCDVTAHNIVERLPNGQVRYSLTAVTF